MATTFEMYSGDSKLLIVSIVDSDGIASDITGATVTYLIKSRIGVEVVRKSSADNDGNLVINGTQVRILLNGEDTADIYGTYKHELEIRDGSGNASTAFQDLILIRKDRIE